MSIPVHRLVARVKPAAAHATLHEWQVGTACVFVGSNDRAGAVRAGDAALLDEQLEVLEYIERATLLEERVRAEGGAVLRAFLDAQNGEPFVLFEPDAPAISRKDGGIPLFLPPRLDEAFVDRVIEGAGGRRLRIDERLNPADRQADYVLQGYVLELKDLQSDPIRTPTRRAAIAELLGPPDSDSQAPTMLRPDGDTRYEAILSRTLKSRIDSAKGQIRDSKRFFGASARGGGVLLLNTGFASLEPDQVFQEAVRLAKNSATVDFVVCMTSRVATNGFDTTALFPFHPQLEDRPPVGTLRESFHREVATLMTDWATGELGNLSPAAVPTTPVVFEACGRRFAVDPGSPSSTMRSDASQET